MHLLQMLFLIVLRRRSNFSAKLKFDFKELLPIIFDTNGRG
jgi:hypothetical protein